MYGEDGPPNDPRHIALLALLFREPESDESAHLGGPGLRSRLPEPAILVERTGDPACCAMLDSFLLEFDVRVEPVTFEQARQAREAFRMFGKGTSRAAELRGLLLLRIGEGVQRRSAVQGERFQPNGSAPGYGVKNPGVSAGSIA